jgi:mannan endo-1,4-beta-mannosidase
MPSRAPLAALVLLVACDGSATLSPGLPTDGGASHDGAPDGAPLPPGPSPREQVLAFLHGISGSQVVAGQHNREPNDQPARWTDAVHDTTGAYPGLWSGDFLFQKDNIDARGDMIAEAARQWQAGALVNLMWHACPPNQDEPCGWEGGVMSHLSDDEWRDLLTDGSPLNQIWKARMDEVAVYLAQLRDQGVGVLFRPLHEMNQGVFWWAGRPGAGGTRDLYRLTHDYLTHEKGLSNLVWIWDVQDLDYDFAAYDPGEDVSDLVALDVYGDGYLSAKYDAIVGVAGERVIAVGECARLPAPAELAAQPRWTFFMAWAELIYSSNSDDEIRSTYDAPPVLTRDELPGWH